MVVMFCCVIYFIIGYTINERNAKYLLAGYNTMSKEQREAFDLKNYLIFFKRFFYNLAIYSGIIFIILFVLYDALSSILIWAVITSLSLFYMVYKGAKFKK